MTAGDDLEATVNALFDGAETLCIRCGQVRQCAPVRGLPVCAHCLAREVDRLVAMLHSGQVPRPLTGAEVERLRAEWAEQARRGEAP